MTTTTIAFLTLIAPIDRHFASHELGESCHGIEYESMWTEWEDSEYEIEILESSSSRLFTTVRYRCWDGVLIGVEAEFDSERGDELRNNLASRWGAPDRFNWFDDYVVRAVVKKKYLPDRLLALYDQTPTRIAEGQPEQ